MKRSRCFLAAFAMVLSAGVAQADVKTQMARETAEFVMRDRAKEVFAEGSEVLARRSAKPPFNMAMRFLKPLRKWAFIAFGR